MSKQEKNIVVDHTAESTEIEAQQAVDSSSFFAKKENEGNNAADSIQKEETSNILVEDSKSEEKATIHQHSGGKGLALLALLVALAVGGTGHFMANKKFTEMNVQIQTISGKLTELKDKELTQTLNIPNFDNEKMQLAELEKNYAKALDRIVQLENAQSSHIQQISSLQLQLQKLDDISGSDKTAWLLSDSNFLLNNAVRKIVLDNDIETAKSLLLEAEQVLSQVPNAVQVRNAIKADLQTLANINQIDQNALMHRVANLTAKLDDLPILDNEQSFTLSSSNQISDSIEDWQENLEKNAISFLDHFIRVSKRNVADEKAFVAPNQEIYLRENIRLRLQIAILAIPRQQNELYKKSLQTVGDWVRSYFETSNENVKNFLKELDELAEQTIYVDMPNSLQSLKVLEQQFNKVSQPIEKVEINAEKELEQVETEKSESTLEQSTAPSAQ